MFMVVTGAVVGASVVPRWCGQDLFVDVVMDNTGLHDTGLHSLAAQLGYSLLHLVAPL